MQKHLGSCYCGNVQFELEAEVDDVVMCNCSFCVRRNAILFPALPESFRILKGAPDEPGGAKTYGSGIFLHHFCPNCGIQCFTLQNGNGRFEPRVNINMGCFDPALVEGLTPRRFDGASLPDDSRLWK